MEKPNGPTGIELYRVYTAHTVTVHGAAGKTYVGEMLCIEQMPQAGGGEAKRDYQAKAWRMTLEGNWVVVRHKDHAKALRIPLTNVRSVELLDEHDRWEERVFPHIVKARKDAEAAAVG